ncbi:MAG: PAS domain-containing protein, partial [Gammaproteobacteria bacterium]
MDDLPNTASMPQPEDSIAGVMDDLAHEQAADVITHQKILFEALIESVLDGILIVSAEGRMLHLNQRFADIWHFPAEIIQSKSDEAALQWAANQTTDPAGFLARVADVYTQPDQEVREEVLMKDGRAYERFGAPIRSGGNWLGWVWTFRDITERKQVEERLRESEHHYRLITQTATDVIITIDANSIILFINDAVVTMFGYTAAELLGKNLN